MSTIVIVLEYVEALSWQDEYLAGGAPPPAHPPLHVAPPAAPGGGAGAAASVAPEPLAAALSVASSSSSLGLDLPPAQEPELQTYAQLYGAFGFSVYGFAAESSELCWDSDSSGDAPPRLLGAFARVFGVVLVVGGTRALAFWLAASAAGGPMLCNGRRSRLAMNSASTIRC